MASSEIQINVEELEMSRTSMTVESLSESTTTVESLPEPTTTVESLPEPTMTVGSLEGIIERVTSEEIQLTPSRSHDSTPVAFRPIPEVSPIMIFLQNVKDLYSEEQKKTFLSAILKCAYIVVCALAVFVDPFFFYIPIVRKDVKCIGQHRSLKIITLSLRSTLDACCVGFILIRRNYFEPRSSKYWVTLERILDALKNFPVIRLIPNWKFDLHDGIDVFAMLPIPQVMFLVLLDLTLDQVKVLSFLVLMQYIPRVLRIYLSCTEFNKTPKRENETWLYFKGVFSFFLFIIVSHVIGGFWYFLAIQKEATCWKDACQGNNNCENTTVFFCNGNSRIGNSTFLNDFCSVDRQNAATSFDFGMFLDATKHGVLESTDIWKKFWHCLWWGLRNLSSLGQNLDTGINTWENIYALFIALCGLLLVLLYLTSNLKVCMQLVTRASTKKRVITQMRMKDLEVQLWLSEHDLPKDIKTLIMDYVHTQLGQSKDVHVENILYILPFEYQKVLKRHLCLPSLLKVPVLQSLDEKVLGAMTEILKPVNYSVNNVIIGEGEPLVMMLYITKGIVLTYPANNAATSSSSSSTIKSLQKGDVYGEELVDWAATFSPFSALPISKRNVKSVSKVEAFALMANDLKIFVTRFKVSFSRRNMKLDDSEVLERTQRMWASTVKATRTQRLYTRQEKGKQKVSE